MPGQKRKYNVRFPPGRIKKIMQKDTEVGRMATAVPVIISLEMFLISFLTKTSLITQSKNSRVMSVNHMKQCIESEKLFDFLKDLAEQAGGAPTPKEVKAKGKCPGHRRKWHNKSIKPMSPEREDVHRRANTEPAIHSDSSSVGNPLITLITKKSVPHIPCDVSCHSLVFQTQGETGSDYAATGCSLMETCVSVDEMVHLSYLANDIVFCLFFIRSPNSSSAWRPLRLDFGCWNSESHPFINSSPLYVK
ncbi:uncharacterized protein [Salminus brasiliensis]|uniref:uncharacterized protein isoform X2 n=1 Tax=Salminus brasiliensis TaxID=930266 RepID=UPI003B82DF7A